MKLIAALVGWGVGNVCTALIGSAELPNIPTSEAWGIALAASFVGACLAAMAVKA